MENMQVIFIILLCNQAYYSLCDLTRQRKVWRKILLQADPIERLTAFILAAKTKFNYSTYQTKFDAKMTKMKWNYTANMIMSVSVTVCHIILYFPIKQGLAINLPWPALSRTSNILLYYNSGILQESLRIFTNNYKQYVPGFLNLCDDKKLKEILNVHLKCNETCIDVTTEEICKFIKMCVMQYEYLILSCEIIWIILMYWLIVENSLFYDAYGADLMYHSLVK